MLAAAPRPPDWVRLSKVVLYMSPPPLIVVLRWVRLSVARLALWDGPEKVVLPNAVALRPVLPPNKVAPIAVALVLNDECCESCCVWTADKSWMDSIWADWTWDGYELNTATDMM